jgi:hypothetical protein
LLKTASDQCQMFSPHLVNDVVLDAAQDCHAVPEKLSTFKRETFIPKYTTRFSESEIMCAVYLNMYVNCRV